MDWKITLIGGTASGKTSYFGALHAKFQSVSLNRLVIEEDQAERARLAGISEQVLFSISRYEYPRDKALLDKMAFGLTKVPIEWPERTRLSDFFPIEFNFRRCAIGKKFFPAQGKKFQIIDIPGESFSPTPRDQTQASADLSKAGGSQALIMFVDTSDFSRGATIYSSVKERIEGVIQKAIGSIRFEGALLPVSIILTKFDIFKKSDWQDIHDRLFEEITLPISMMSSRLLVMSCPTSLTSRYFDQFYPINIEYPFLFSAMGIIMGQALETAELITATQSNIRSSGWFSRLIQSVFDVEGIGVMKKLEKADLVLARSILQSIYLDQVLDRTAIRFCHNGEETKIANILRGFTG